MNSKQLALKAIALGEAATWASAEVKRQIAFSRCAEHLYWCDDPRILPAAAITAQSALDYVMMHFNYQNEPQRETED